MEDRCALWPQQQQRSAHQQRAPAEGDEIKRQMLWKNSVAFDKRSYFQYLKSKILPLSPGSKLHCTRQIWRWHHPLWWRGWPARPPWAQRKRLLYAGHRHLRPSWQLPRHAGGDLWPRHLHQPLWHRGRGGFQGQRRALRPVRHRVVPRRGEGSPNGQAVTGGPGVDQLLAGERSEPAVWRDEELGCGEGRREGFLPLLHWGEERHDQTLKGGEDGGSSGLVGF